MSGRGRYFVQEVFEATEIEAIKARIAYDAEAEMFHLTDGACPACGHAGLQVLSDATTIPAGTLAIGDDETLRITCRCGQEHQLEADATVVHRWCGRSVAGVEIPEGL